MLQAAELQYQAIYNIIVILFGKGNIPYDRVIQSSKEVHTDKQDHTDKQVFAQAFIRRAHLAVPVATPTRRWVSDIRTESLPSRHHS